MNVQKKTATPMLLNKLASLTTIRDAELFELSLLKTLADLLKIKQLSMYKLNHSNVDCKMIVYKAKCVENYNKKEISESHEILTADTHIPKEIMTAQLWINKTGKPYIHYNKSYFSIVYPIFGANKIESLLSFQLNHHLTEAEMLIINSLLSITYNFHSLLNENQKDKLTGLLNRQTFEESINKIHSLSSFNTNNEQQNKLNRPDKSASDKALTMSCLAIIDIDNFKKVNDNFGHLIGDEVLLVLAYVMKQTFSADALLFRFGGEEFVCIIRTQNTEDARKALEDFRRKVEDYDFPQVNKITVSIGAVFIEGENIIVSEIIGRADKALYHAKNNGRNQLYFYEDLLENGDIEEVIETGTIDLF